MIDIDKISFRNFLSYGDQETTIKVAGLGPCLITGKNGAGKSTIVDSILYPLFGRTMRGAKPGSNVVNMYTGGTCVTNMWLKNGDRITRSFNDSGKSELIVERGGEQLLNTLSTAASQQSQLNRLLELDWHGFRSTSFLTQIGSTWLEMIDAQRKKELERALKVDRLTLRAQIAKTKLDGAIQEQKRISSKLDQMTAQLSSIKSDLDDAIKANSEFDDDRDSKVAKAVEQADTYATQYDQMVVPDIEALESEWNKIEKAKTMLAELERKSLDKASAITTLEQEIREAKRRVDLWTSKAGKVCMACEQEVTHEYSDDKSKKYVDDLASASQLLEAANNSRTKVIGKIASVKEIIRQYRPELSLNEAKMMLKQKDQLLASSQKWLAHAEKIKGEVNPHGKTIDKLQGRIDKLEGEITALKNELDEIEVVIRHQSYISRSYADRKKIRSYSVASRVPLLNKKINHYLSRFKLDFSMEVTDSLAVNYSGVHYDYMAGGERKRVDVAFLLARFDLHNEIYGRQSNVIVLDEVDSRMDDDGVECLADIILNDLAPKVDAVLVISHKMMMRELFPTQLVVENTDKLSSLTLIK